MNVIVSNKYQTLLSNLNIDVIKNINGVFSVDDLAVQFRNFFYNKMILDLTALENYEDINTRISNSIILGLRKINGINIIEFNKKYNTNIIDLYNIKELIKEKKLTLKNNQLFISKKYFYTSNDILINFI